MNRAYRRWVCVLATACATAIVSNAQTQDTIAIAGVSVIDTINGRAVPVRTVTIRNATIVSVTAGTATAPGVRRVDGRGKFLIPGLWDMHAHHQMTGEASLPLFVANGVTGTRDMGADLDLILRLRQRTASGDVLGPRIMAAGPILDDRPPDWPYRLTVRSADEARKAVQLLKERGVDLVKVHDRTPPEAYHAIADEARRQGLPFAGHLPRGITIEAAAAAGQRSIEHLAGLRLFNQCSGGPTYSAEKCRTFFEWLARSGMWQTPTLVNWRTMFTLGTPEGDAEQDHLTYASPGLLEFLALNRTMSNVSAEAVRNLVAAADAMAVAVADMQKAGVGILAGCDGMVAGFCLQYELKLFVKGGMPAAAALQSATINAARSLGLEKVHGTVDAGKRADLVLLDANPLDDIANVSRIHAVVFDGRLLDRTQLDATLASVRKQFQMQRANPGPQ
jgi:imidazolonepropionase-like amidohydrolase